MKYPTNKLLLPGNFLPEHGSGRHGLRLPHAMQAPSLAANGARVQGWTGQILCSALNDNNAGKTT